MSGQHAASSGETCLDTRNSDVSNGEGEAEGSERPTLAGVAPGCKRGVSEDD